MPTRPVRLVIFMHSFTLDKLDVLNGAAADGVSSVGVRSGRSGCESRISTSWMGVSIVKHTVAEGDCSHTLVTVGCPRSRDCGQQVDVALFIGRSVDTGAA